MGTRIRAFVGLGLPAGQRQLLSSHLQDCAALAPDYRWVAPDGLHLTLRFLGSLDGTALDRVRVELGRVHARPFRLGLDGLGTFGSRAAPRVVWVRVGDGLEDCAALARGVEDACRRARIEPDERGFRAHVTLARQRTDRARLPQLPEPPALPPWPVEEFLLYESRLGRQPQYVPLERYPLTA